MLNNMNLQLFHHPKRFIQRIAIKFIKATNPNSDQSIKYHINYDHELITICKKIILNPKTILLISPLSDKRYVKSDDEQLFIIIENHQFTIVNHSYSYYIHIEDKTYKRIILLFDTEIEQRRKAMEEEIRSNIKHSLSNIYKKLINGKI